MKPKTGELQHEETQAKTIVALLDQNLASIDPLTLSKLKYGREQALSKMPSMESIADRGVLYILSTHQQKIRFSIIALLLVLGIFLVLHENMQDFNQGDAYLLGSELPPEAYLNEGFETWLSENL